MSTQSSSQSSPMKRSTHKSIRESESNAESKMNDDIPTTPADLNLLVEDLLEQMVRSSFLKIIKAPNYKFDCYLTNCLFDNFKNTRFTDVGMSILRRMDDMGSRIDELEQSIVSLMDQAGIDRDSSTNNSFISSHQSTPFLPSTIPRSSGELTLSDGNMTNNTKSPTLPRRNQSVEI
jgi:Heat shock factor binding protein 1